MKSKLKIAMAVSAILSGSFFAQAGGEGWSQDFAASAKKAADENKVMLVDFTGSDWCGWCIKLNKEVFSHDEFKDGVKDGYVLVELDFPRDKTKVSPETLEQNKELAKKYSVRGYPTILLMDGEGRPFAKTGYQQGGPVEYVKHLNELTAIRTQRDEEFAKADKLEGVEKAKALVAALKGMDIDDALLSEFYGTKIDEIKASDPADESGFAKGIEAKAKFAGFEKELNTLASAGKFNKALALTKKTIASGDYEGSMLQQVTFIQGMIHAELGQMDKAVESLDKADAVVPGSPIAPRIAAVKAQILKKQEEDKAKAGEPKAEEEKVEEAKPDEEKAE